MKGHQMKLHTILLATAMAVALTTGYVKAQDQDRPPRQRPEGEQGRRPPMPPLVAALDANHDGTIDASEIDNAPAALRKLDKNNDGKLTASELRPPRPDGEGRPEGQGRRPGGPRPPRDGDGDSFRRGPGHQAPPNQPPNAD
jgi:hypothetical protein